MSLDTETMSKEFLTVILAAGLMVFKPVTPASACDLSEALVAEAERRYGKLNP